MSWKNFACVAALSAIVATPALAVPSLSFVDNLDGTVTLQVTPSGTGSIATEIAITADNDLTSAVIADATTFDTDNPGNNTNTGTETTGLVSDLAGDAIFGSHGSIVLASASPVSYITVGYTGSGTISAAGLVAEGAANFTGLTASIAVTDGVVLAGDFDGSGAVGDGDLTLLLSNWGATVPPVPAGWVGAQPTPTGIGDDELTALLSTWGQSASGATAVPEPTAALLALIAGIAGLGVRRNG